MTTLDNQFEKWWIEGVTNGFDLPDAAKDSVRKAWRAGIRFALEQEPSEAMMREGADFLSITPGGATNKCAGHVYEAMMAIRIKELG
jgi:hypothetical protein